MRKTPLKKWILWTLLMCLGSPAGAEPKTLTREGSLQQTADGTTITEEPSAVSSDTLPSPPTNVHAERQDFQAVRVTWDEMGNSLKYLFYAAIDEEPLEFHKENDGNPLTQHFVIWDAPRNGPRRFVFYVTCVDPQGRESPPSDVVQVDLGPLPWDP